MSNFVCFEPVSHVADAHNRGSVDKWNGLPVLGHGESLAAGCSFAVMWGDQLTSKSKSRRASEGVAAIC
ncbi:hypothetical protein [Mesorhizobium japonicum]|uniref:Mll7078 protein n=1 Tax=Mesorhizobium japonicum (strain LMG 29417 / CECT 9101 / MAFF 303099) TaxID=266835 RepID=Q987F0_RHILO|nr:hypothetical protein [Mesorhizobium japonicum]BAB53253.1 mll7078 [Mesorhizobium japonicum MAFF 303099]